MRGVQCYCLSLLLPLGTLLCEQVLTGEYEGLCYGPPKPALSLLDELCIGTIACFLSSCLWI